MKWLKNYFPRICISFLISFITIAGTLPEKDNSSEVLDFKFEISEKFKIQDLERINLLSNVIITIESLQGQVKDQFVTSSKGEVSFSLQPGDFYVRIQKKGFEPQLIKLIASEPGKIGSFSTKVSLKRGEASFPDRDEARIVMLNETKKPVQHASGETKAMKPVYGNIPLETLSKEDLSYYIQVGADVSPVPSAYFSQLDQVREIKFKKVFHYVTGEYGSLEEALKALPEIRNKGFKGAFVTSYINGERMPTNKVLSLIASR